MFSAFTTCRAKRTTLNSKKLSMDKGLENGITKFQCIKKKKKKGIERKRSHNVSLPCPQLSPLAELNDQNCTQKNFQWIKVQKMEPRNSTAFKKEKKGIQGKRSHNVSLPCPQLSPLVELDNQNKTQA